MFYTLYNKSNKTYLTHPTVGLWYCTEQNEAQEMLKACRAYLHEAGLDFMIEHIFVSEFENEEDLNRNVQHQIRQNNEEPICR